MGGAGGGRSTFPCPRSLWLKSINSSDIKQQLETTTTTHTRIPYLHSHLCLVSYGWQSIFALYLAKCSLGMRTKHRVLKALNIKLKALLPAFLSLSSPSLCSWIELAATPINHGDFAPPTYTAAQFTAGDHMHMHGVRTPWETGWNALISRWRCWTGLPLSLVNHGFTFNTFWY